MPVGVGAELASNSSSTNRISFKVPLALPVDPITEEELKKQDIAQAQRTKKNLGKIKADEQYRKGCIDRY